MNTAIEGLYPLSNTSVISPKVATSAASGKTRSETSIARTAALRQSGPGGAKRWAIQPAAKDAIAETLQMIALPPSKTKPQNLVGSAYPHVS